MDLYTMNENFIPDKMVDEFQSVIWTERCSSAGEIQLVVPGEPYYLDMLREGTYLGLAGSREIVEIQTNSIEKGLLTVVGKTMVKFLDERLHWPKTDDSSQPIGDYIAESAKLGELVADRVDKMVINPVPFPSSGVWTDLNLVWDMEKIEHLELGDIDHSGTEGRWTVPVGPLYTVIQQLAEKDGLGISIYLESADAELGYVLKFTTYRGVDRTSGQTTVPLIRLTPNMETLTDLKEIRSIDGYKNVVYVNYKNRLTIHYEDPNYVPTGLKRRVLLTDAQGEPVGQKPTTSSRLLYSAGGSYGGGGGISSSYGAVGQMYGGAYSHVPSIPDPQEMAFREQNAKDALANYNYIRAIDGQISTQISEYKFGVDYGMGDILELEGLTGILQKARVTEYIRSQDSTGEREYPTLSVIIPPVESPT